MSEQANAAFEAWSKQAGVYNLDDWHSGKVAFWAGHTSRDSEVANLLETIRVGGELLLKAPNEKLQAALTALRCLYDEQNGPPLLSDRPQAGWRAAYEAAGRLLREAGA